MAITYWRIKRMRLKNKLALIYTGVFTVTLAVAFATIYIFSENFRQEEFYNRLHDRTVSTFKISIQVEQIDNKLLKVFDENTINSLGNEKILLFDSAGKFLYSSTDSLDVYRYKNILSKLDSENPEYESSDGKYDLLGLRFTDKGRTYYGIARAYDRFGKSKISYLAVLLVVTFIVAVILIVILSFVLSDLITKPLSLLAQEIDKISPPSLANQVTVAETEDEIGFVANKFNELLGRVDTAFKFQTYYLHHLSHELKTPLAVMMASAEQSLSGRDPEKFEAGLLYQKSAIKELSNIIDALLDISKTEQKLINIESETIRVDEIIFECMDEIKFLNNDVSFDLDVRDVSEETDLMIKGNSRMIKMVIINLLKNAVNYSEKEKPAISISSSSGKLQIVIRNDGLLIAPGDQGKLFSHSFRGRNSGKVKGFGMGLPLSQQIVSMHNGTLDYSVCETNKNCFTLVLPKGAIVA